MTTSSLPTLDKSGVLHDGFACRSCGSHDVVTFLPLGLSPLANGLLPEGFEGAEPVYPLDVALCRSCALVQLTFAPPPDDLFRIYPYFSSFSDTMVSHAGQLAQSLISRRHLDESSLVIEIASNDGYLLQFYKAAGIPVLGIEPALNIADAARARGIETISEFFGSDLGRSLAASNRQADIVHAHNVLAHVPDLNGFVAGIKTVLKPDGVAVIEVPYVRDLIEKAEFDTIYHEHLSYFSVSALDSLFKRHSLRLIDVERVVIHGGSLRLTVGLLDSNEQADPRVQSILDEERSLGMTAEPYYQGFSSRVVQVKTELVAMLTDLKRQGKRLAAYGASAKGTTLLTYCGIGPDLLDYIVDRSSVKQGHRAPGSHLVIFPPEHLLADMPDYCLLLVWNFAAEVIEQQSEYLSRGGRFIIPLPTPAILEA